MPSALRSDGQEEAAPHPYGEIRRTNFETLTPRRGDYKWLLLRKTEFDHTKTGMPTKLKTEIIAAAIAGFEEQKKRLNAQIAELRQMLNPSATDGSTPTPVRRRMSAAARARIAAAQRKRWAAARKQAGAPSPGTRARKKRMLSSAGRKAIIEATKRRWAAFRKSQAR